MIILINLGLITIPKANNVGACVKKKKKTTFLSLEPYACLLFEGISTYRESYI